MASTVQQIPIELMRFDRKLEVIAFIKSLRLPSRFARKMLQDWGEAVQADLDSTAYELVSTPGATLTTGA